MSCAGPLLGVLAVLASCSSGTEPAPPEAPSFVLLVSLDTVRADRLGVYGHERPNTPHLDAFARDAVLFETVGAQATHTLLSHKSMFAAKLPLRLLRETTGETMEQLIAAPRRRKHAVSVFRDLSSKSLVGRFRRAGYRTTAFTDGVWMGEEMGFQQGFDHYDASAGHFAEILPRVTRWLDGRSEPKTFLFVHAYDAHCPYPCREPMNSLYCADHGAHLDLEGKCPKPDLESMELGEDEYRALRDHYDGGIASADAYVGDLLAKLRELDLYDEGLIAITSDHGESLGEDGWIGHSSLRVEQLLVPLLVKFPASWGLAGRRVSEPAALLDVLPTLAEACAVKIPRDLDGRSLLALARGEGRGRDALVAQITLREGRAGVTHLTKRAILEPGRWLVVEDLAGDTVEAFDLGADAGGLVRTDARPAEVEALVTRLAGYDDADTGRAADEIEEFEMTEDFQRRLEALGYVGGEE